jgi:hypothetical protein
MRKKNRYFLQHGVIKDILDFLLYNNTYMYRFSVSTKAEYDFVCEKFGYPDGHICLTGLCRFDGLIDAKTNKDQILVMPTWRQWISKGVECKEIEGSDVFETHFTLLITFDNSLVCFNWRCTCCKAKNTTTIFIYLLNKNFSSLL